MGPGLMLLLAAQLSLDLEVGLGVEASLATHCREELAQALARHTGEAVVVEPGAAVRSSVNASLFGAPRRLRLLAERLDTGATLVRRVDVEIPRDVPLRPYLDNVALRLFPEVRPKPAVPPPVVEADPGGVGAGPILLAIGGAVVATGVVLGGLSLVARAELGAPDVVDLAAVASERRAYAVGAGIALSLGVALVLGGVLALD